MGDRVRTTFGQLGELFDGPHATPTRRAQGPYFLNIASLKSGRLDLTESDHVSREDFVQWTRRVTPRAGDLLFSYETRLGEAALMPADVEACLGRRMALLRPNKNIIDSRFLLYFYLSPAFQRMIAKHTVHGATVPRIGLATMPRWEVDIPPLADQRAIAEVLGVLDDKIAANDRQLRLIRELADSVFVRAAGELSQSGLTFGDVAEVGGGGTPRTTVDEFWGGPIRWATPTDVTALPAPYLSSTKRTITDAGMAACASSLYPAGSILMTSRATVGAFAVAQVPITVNQGFIVVNAKESVFQWWLFHEMRSRVQEFLTFANGATFLELPRGRFKALRLRLPDLGAARRFDSAVRPLHAMAAGLVVENRQLVATRDELLPLLMSGKVRVRGAANIH